MRFWRSGVSLLLIGPYGTAFASGDDRLTLTAAIGAEYDSHVSAEPNDVTTSRGDKAALLSASATFKLVNTKPVTLRVGYDFDQTLYEDATDFDLQIHALSAGASLRKGKATLGVDYRFSHFRMNGDRFLDLHSISPSVAGFVSRRIFVRTALTYSEKSFATAVTLNAKTYAANVDVYRYFARRRGYIAVGGRYDYEDTAGLAFKYHGFQTNVRVQVPVSLFKQAARVRVSYAYNQRDYRYDTASIGAPRKERRSTFAATLEAPLSRHLTIQPQFRYVDRASNVAIADYREHVMSLSLRYRV
jgi:Surface lipoprotein assembly modifier